MFNSCEKRVTYGVVNEAGRRVPYVFRYAERPLLDTSRLPAPLARGVELTLGMGVVGVDGIKRMYQENPLKLAGAIAVGTFGLGAAATAVTYLLYQLSK